MALDNNGFGLVPEPSKNLQFVQSFGTNVTKEDFNINTMGGLLVLSAFLRILTSLMVT
jgi:hypothetical protein